MLLDQHLHLCLGPVAGVLARYIDIWKLSLVGCILGSLAVVVCFFAKGLIFLAVFLGIVHGTSIGLLALCSVVINQYFNRYRATASGISNAGFTVGGLIFPPLIQALFDKYGIRGTFLLVGALMLNSTAAALLQRYPPDQGSTRPTGHQQASDHHMKRLLVVCAKSDDNELNGGTEAVVNNNRNGCPGVQLVEDIGYDRGVTCGASGRDIFHGSVLCPGPDVLQDVKKHDDRALPEQDVLCDTAACRDIRKDNCVDTIRTDLNTASEDKPDTSAVDTNSNENAGIVAENKPNIDQEDAPFLDQPSATSPSLLKRAYEDPCTKTKPENFLSFLLVPKFYLITLSFAQILSTMTTYMTVIVDFATDRNVDRWNAVFLISAYTIADLVARLGSGWITDRGLLSRSTMMGSHLFIWGVTLYLTPACNEYYYQLTSSVVCGWCNGCTLILIAVLFMELVGIEKLGVCFGVATFLTGLLGLARPAIIGYFRDSRGDYEGLFNLLGGLAVSVAFVWLCLSVKHRCEARLRKLKSGVTDGIVTLSDKPSKMTNP
ncbi:uncharacterized protein LOC135394728 isoform X2 [Ornithodoros turicata]|uniref:uncharacterized protein LOC135394728 isoform X2 n=1 Tax=Ornithodoros turicata TaxID=34597 RepID=UPI003139C864